MKNEKKKSTHYRSTHLLDMFWKTVVLKIDKTSSLNLHIKIRVKDLICVCLQYHSKTESYRGGKRH